MWGLTARRPYRGGPWVFKALAPFQTTERSQDSEDVRRRTLAYASCLVAAALALAVLLVALGYGLGSPVAVLMLALISAIAEQSRVRLTTSIEISISLLPTLFAAVAFGPLAAMLVAAASMLGDLREDRLKWAVYSSSEAITGAATGLVAGAVIGQATDGFGTIVLATLAGAVTAQAIDVGFCWLTLRVRRVGNTAQIARALSPIIAGSIILYAPVVAIVVYAYREVSPWTLPLFLAPTLTAHRLYVLYQQQRHLTDDISAANKRLEDANISFATALVAALDARDNYTAGHSAAVAIYAQHIAERMGLSLAEQQLAHVTGLVHDIGKIGLLASLLENQGPMSLAERRQMERHSEIGERILLNVEDYADVAKCVRHHHERVDGMGYPDGLEGDAIPLISRIIAVADAYDAMISDRPYRDAMPSRVARLRLAQAVGSQFDIAVVAAFEAILAAASEEYRAGRTPAFTFTSEAWPTLRISSAQ
jgi:putative nucleotidyltransferase with HDIG domain